MSKSLGITQSRVRNLRIKKQLLYPKNFDWKERLAKSIENARYDEVSRKILISITDPNLFIEIQHFIEDNGGFIEVQLNSKLLQIRVEYLISLLVELEGRDGDLIIKDIKKKLLIENHNEEKLSRESLPALLMKESPDFIIGVLELISGGGVGVVNQIAKSVIRCLV